MAFEVGVVGLRFATFFASSDNLVGWRYFGDRYVFSKDFHTACLTFRHVGEYFYMFYLADVSQPLQREYETDLTRSPDLVHWEISPHNPVISRSSEDHRIYHDLPDDEHKRIEIAMNINNSDINLCECEIRLVLGDPWGNQFYIEYLAEARFNGTLRELVESHFAPQVR